MNIYRSEYSRKTVAYTKAIVSFTKDGIRHTEEEVKFNGMAIDNKYELYNILKRMKDVHSITETYYFEE